ncbi:MAG: deoxyribonuclease IV [Candidatus Sumerlaeaceae bacterium]|nr:deoxyribonuclease IV [Candidatus Sumerlaeaceae bacterium]
MAKSDRRPCCLNSAPPLLLGAHVSIAGGVHKAIERGAEHGCTAIQIFVKGNTRWDFPPLDSLEIKMFKEARRNSSVKCVIAHAIYLINLASGDPVVRHKSIADVVDELRRCEALGVDSLVIHPGAHGGLGTEAGIQNVARALDEIFDQVGKCRCHLLLETTAGQGTALAATFEELRAIIAQTSRRRRLGVCLDTAHVFAAGYDLRTAEGYANLWRDFDAALGRGLLRAIHLNDSKGRCGSRLDRHEHIGKGLIGQQAFRRLVTDARLRGIPMVTETPSSPDPKEIRWLFSVAKRARSMPQE